MKIQHLILPVVAGLVFACGSFTVRGATDPNVSQSSVQKEIQRKLANLPYYGVFDNIAFRIDGSQVTLTGQVVNPVLKDDAATALKGVEGVATVVNDLEVLPPSSMDAGIRRAIFHAIYNDPAMSQYAIEPIPSIHIIVKNGNVRLVGVVANATDKNIAYLRANSVPGTFAVNNDLQVVPGA